MRTECAAPGCGKPIVAGMLMCRIHWFQVPARTRANVNHTWRRVSLMRRDVPGYLTALRAYRDARDEALMSVGATPGDPK